MDAGNINWRRLTSALTFYNMSGYNQIDLDWTVEEKTSEITKPFGKKDFFVYDKVLVASGEQSFLEMMKNNKLKQGKYCGITPCFRDEYELDHIHQTYFMKVELIDTIQPNKKGLDKMLDYSLEFFSNYTEVRALEIGDELYDIIDTKTGIELGSYGTRQYKNLKWVFGTGLAEPRLTKVINLNAKA